MTLPALLLVAVVAVALTGCGEDTESAGTTTTETTAPPPAPSLQEDADQVQDDLDGIEQQGLLLGDPDAPIMIVEYANLECPQCIELHRTVVPEVIDRYVRTGEANLEIRPVTSSPRSQELARGAHAATPQQRGWDQAQLSLLRGEISSAEPPSEFAAALGLDMKRWREDLERPEWETLMTAANNVVAVGRWQASPVFLIRRQGFEGPFVELLQPTSVEEFEQAIEEARNA